MTINRDLALAFVYLATGLAGLWFGRNLQFGTLAHMGPGTFPKLIAASLVVFGLASLVRALVRPTRSVETVAWKPLAVVTLSILAFALLLPLAGFLPAIVVLGLGAASASRRFALRPLPVIGLVAFAIACHVVFVVLLGLPLPRSGFALPWIGGL